MAPGEVRAQPQSRVTHIDQVEAHVQGMVNRKTAVVTKNDVGILILDQARGAVAGVAATARCAGTPR